MENNNAEHLLETEGIHKRGDVHPWTRYFARCTDLTIAAIVLTPILLIAMPGIFTGPNSEASFGLAVPFIWIFVEAILLSTIGTTFGKWVLKTTVVMMDGGKLSFGIALRRSFAVWFKGIGIGFPMFALFTMSYGYSNLSKKGTATWDRKLGCVVSHKKVGVLGIVIVVLVFLAAIVSIIIAQTADK
jgi:hypothetical protein